MRYLAFDVGDKRTGVAAGDAETGVVTPLTVVEVALVIQGGNALVEALARMCEEHLGSVVSKAAASKAPGELVCGLPLNMDGSEGPRSKIVRAFADRLAARTHRKVHLQDERLSSAEADWTMARSGLTRGEKKERRDARAAAVILQDFLAGQARGTPAG